MLSYMLPVDEKPPPGPGKTHLQLSLEPLTNGNRENCISKENSISSFASDATTVTASHSSATPTSTSDRVKPKLLMNGKHQSLKRVSFGSSKGSMVETLVYETPVQEEPEPSPIVENETPFPEDHDQTEDEREKVRVSFVQQSKPLEVVLPDEPLIIADTDFIMATTTVVNESNHIVTMYNRQESVDSGWDNPFRPGGDLSREADEIVELIKGGKPITPTSGNGNAESPLLGRDHIDSNNTSTPIVESPKKSVGPAPLSATPKSAKNGNVQQQVKDRPVEKKDGHVEVQKSVVNASDASQVEHSFNDRSLTRAKLVNQKSILKSQLKTQQ